MKYTDRFQRGLQWNTESELRHVLWDGLITDLFESDHTKTEHEFDSRRLNRRCRVLFADAIVRVADQ